MSTGVAVCLAGTVVFCAASAAAQSPSQEPPLVTPPSAVAIERPAAPKPSTTAPEEKAQSVAISAPTGQTPGQRPGDAPAEKALCNWNVGAGLVASGNSLSLLSAPTYAAMVERRVGAKTWLALNGAFSYDSRNEPVTPGDDQPARTTIGVRSVSATLLVGLRYELVQSLVTISVFSAAFAGYQRSDHDALRSGENPIGFPIAPSVVHIAGLVAGLAVERELLDQLSVRFSLDVASASLSRTETGTINALGVATPVTLNDRRFGVALRPALELHFYF